LLDQSSDAAAQVIRCLILIRRLRRHLVAYDWKENAELREWFSLPGGVRLTLNVFNLIRIDVLELVHDLVVTRVEINPNGILFGFKLKQNSDGNHESLSENSFNFRRYRNYLLDILLDILNRLAIGISQSAFQS